MKFEVVHKWTRRTMLTLSIGVALAAATIIGCGSSRYDEALDPIQQEALDGELVAHIDRARVYRIEDQGNVCYLVIRRGYAPAISCMQSK